MYDYTTFTFTTLAGQFVANIDVCDEPTLDIYTEDHWFIDAITRIIMKLPDVLTYDNIRVIVKPGSTLMFVYAD